MVGLSCTVLILRCMRSLSCFWSPRTIISAVIPPLSVMDGVKRKLGKNGFSNSRRFYQWRYNMPARPFFSWRVSLSPPRMCCVCVFVFAFRTRVQTCAHDFSLISMSVISSGLFVFLPFLVVWPFLVRLNPATSSSFSGRVEETNLSCPRPLHCRNCAFSVRGLGVYLGDLEQAALCVASED